VRVKCLFGLIGEGPAGCKDFLGTRVMRSAKSHTAHDQSKATPACFVFKKKLEGELPALKRTLVTEAEGRKKEGKKN